MKYKIIVPGMALVTALQGCGSGIEQKNQLAQAITQAPSCSSLRDSLWTELYRQIDIVGVLPPAVELAPAIDGLVKGIGTRNALVKLYGHLERNVRGFDREEALRALAEMELGDRTTEEKSARQDDVERNLEAVKRVAVQELGECTHPDESTHPDVPSSGGSNSSGAQVSADPIPLFEVFRTSASSPALYGAYKTISVGYQSCNVLDQKLVTTATPGVSGIIDTGRHPNGVGRKREVGDASKVFRSNLYYAGRKSPGGGCFTATSSPLIYDYGGKPYATSTNVLDLAKNAGSGTSSLGIDCSGFVSSAVLTGGLRLRSGSSSKAAQTSGVNAAMFASPKANGLSCFTSLTSTATQTLKPGDVIANTGHVIMVDRVGADPFGIQKAKTAADCAKVTYSGFDFSIIQSSAGKGGIGMNRYRAVDFLAGYASMRTGLTSYAQSICKVRLGLAAATTLANTSQAVVVRHTGTTACSDVKIPLAGESCLKSCAPNTLLADET